MEAAQKKAKQLIDENAVSKLTRREREDGGQGTEPRAR